MYSKLEKEFLRIHNVKLVDDPDAFDLIDHGTLVLFTALDYDVTYWISQGEWPAAMLTSYSNSRVSEDLWQVYSKHYIGWEQPDSD